jgi:hypothetical protein
MIASLAYSQNSSVFDMAPSQCLPTGSIATTFCVIICCGYALKLKLTVPIFVRCEVRNSIAGKRRLHRVVRDYRSCRVEVLRMGTRIIGEGANELRKGGGRLGACTEKPLAPRGCQGGVLLYRAHEVPALIIRLAPWKRNIVAHECHGAFEPFTGL